MQLKLQKLSSFAFCLAISFVLPTFFPTIVENCKNPLGIETSFYGALGLLSLVLFYILTKKYFAPTKLMSMSTGMVLGGGIYNGGYRFLSGCVPDYFVWGELMFNIADVFVCVGLALLFCYTLHTDGRTNTEAHNLNN